MARRISRRKRGSGFRRKLGARPKEDWQSDPGRSGRMQKHQSKLRSCISSGYAALPGGSRAHATGSAEKLAVREACRKKSKGK